MLAHSFYLTQRFGVREKPSKTEGFSRFLDPDYMGSTEFEFGALGSALRLTRKHHQELGYSLQPLMIPGWSVPLWVAVLPGHHVHAICADIRDLALGAGPDTKEYLHLDRALSAKERGNGPVSVPGCRYQVWCTVPRYSAHEGDPVFYPVWIATQKRYLVAVLEEAARPLKSLVRASPKEIPAPAVPKFDASDCRLHDTVQVEQQGSWQPATLIGFYEHVANVRMADGRKLTVPYTRIQKG